MQSIWKTAEGCKQLALALLALALVGIAIVLMAGNKMAAMQGPGTVGVSSAGTLWLTVNDELWVLDAQGHLAQRKPFAELGVLEPASNIVALPDGNMLLASRGDSALQVLDARTLARIRTVRLQWPDEFDGNARAIHVAVSPQGQFAVATGGGHAVLLFDAEGRMLRRTAPGTFYFTNGIRHSSEGWWTTDTNRSRIHLLDEQSLEVRRTVALDAAPPGYTALGELAASQADPRASNGIAPLATVTRLGYRMEVGQVADVFADGTQILFNENPIILRDIAWFDGHLIAVDGGSFRLLRFGADRSPMSDLGDAGVQSALREMQGKREFWSALSSRWGLVISLALLLAGIGVYGRHKKLAALAVLEERPSTSRAPSLPVAVVVGQRLRIYGIPIMVRLASMVAGFMVLAPLLKKFVFPPAETSALVASNVVVFSVAIPLFLAALWQQWRHDKLMRDPLLEPVLNLKGHAWLHDHTDWDAVAEPGETPRESLFVTGWNKRWLLVTNMRVLLFAASARERKLQQEWARCDIAYAGSPEEAPGGKTYSLFRRLMWPVPNLQLVFSDGSQVKLRCASTVSAEWVGHLLMMGRRDPAQPQVLPASKPAKRRWREVVAAFAVPGSGQWLQGRFVTGTVLFTAAVLVCFFVWGPVLWAATGPKMHVGQFSKTVALSYWFALSLAAAADAFHFSMRSTRTRRRSDGRHTGAPALGR